VGLDSDAKQLAAERLKALYGSASSPAASPRLGGAAHAPPDSLAAPAAPDDEGGGAAEAAAASGKAAGEQAVGAGVVPPALLRPLALLLVLADAGQAYEPVSRRQLEREGGPGEVDGEGGSGAPAGRLSGAWALPARLIEEASAAEADTAQDATPASNAGRGSGAEAPSSPDAALRALLARAPAWVDSCAAAHGLLAMEPDDPSERLRRNLTPEQVSE
jgi:hypothetical protein